MSRTDAVAAELQKGAAARAEGRLEAAAQHYLEALNLQPDLVEAARELSLLWGQLDDADQAEYFTRLAIDLDPGSAAMQLHLGNLLRAQGRLEEALAACQAATTLQPDLAQAHGNLGNAYRDLGRGEEAAASFRRALELAPELPEAHLSYGILLYQSGDVRGAMRHYDAALRSRPGFAPALLNLGFAHEQLGEAGEARACYARAIEADPGYAEAHVNHALQSLLAGEFEQGWREYEWRWKLPAWRGLQPLAGVPRWNGEPLEGRTIVLYAEQGFGDVLQFARYARLVAGRGATVVLRCQPKLAAVLASVPGVSMAVASEGELPPCDLSCSLLSLPRIFGTTLATIPAEVPYIRSDPAKAARWRERLDADRATLRIGLHWATDSAMAGSSAKSLALSELAALGGVEGAVFYSLQRGAAASEARQPPAGMQIRSLEGELRDFSDDAALLANLDLVISIDTATAHLAGAMGVAVWTLIRHPAEWRWQSSGERTPWYPTMRLFRQGAGKGWEHVVPRVAEALRIKRH
jgi:tetratricopeptide (TPR) repeat protein